MLSFRKILKFRIFLFRYWKSVWTWICFTSSHIFFLPRLTFFFTLSHIFFNLVSHFFILKIATWFNIFLFTYNLYHIHWYLKYIIFKMFPRIVFRKEFRYFFSVFDVENLSGFRIVLTSSHIMRNLVSRFGIFPI